MFARLVLDSSNPGSDDGVASDCPGDKHTVSNSETDRAALTIKFLLLVIFLVIRKYTRPQREDFLRRRPAVALSSSTILDGGACFQTAALFYCLLPSCRRYKNRLFNAAVALRLSLLLSSSSFDTLISRSLTTSPAAVIPSFTGRTSSRSRSFCHCGADACRPRLRGFSHPLLPAPTFLPTFLCTLL